MTKEEKERGRIDFVKGGVKNVVLWDGAACSFEDVNEYFVKCGLFDYEIARAVLELEAEGIIEKEVNNGDILYRLVK